MSANLAIVTGPARVGSFVKTTPASFRRLVSAAMSLDSNEVSGIPCSNIAFWNAFPAGFAFGSSESSRSEGPSGETTVIQRGVDTHCLGVVLHQLIGMPQEPLVRLERLVLDVPPERLLVARKSWLPLNENLPLAVRLSADRIVTE